MKVEKIELPKELTEDTALAFIGKIASVCTGKFESAKTEPIEKSIARGRRNLTESLGKPTRAWEFLPFYYPNARYCNFREMINYGEQLYWLTGEYNNQDNSSFRILKLTVPKFVVRHFRTHTTLSQLESSARLMPFYGGGKEYWFPEIEKDDAANSLFYQGLLLENRGEYFYKEMTGRSFSNVLQAYYTRKEIYSRSLSDFEMVDLVIGGYSDAWKHFTDLRTSKGVQKETVEIAEMIKIELAEAMRGE